MARGVLPTYTRISHTRNILEGYRYVSRSNITVLSSRLGMSYHTVRRLCTEATRPQDRTMDKLERALPFINRDSWEDWLDKCQQALYAEKQEDIGTLLMIETSLEAMLPEADLKKPLHFMPGTSLSTAKVLHEGSLNSKSCSFYLSTVHSTAMDLLSINLDMTKSELLRNMIDSYLLNNVEVSEALIQVVTGMPAQQVAPKDPSIMEVTTKELDAMLPASLDLEEALHQLSVPLPESVDLPTSTNRSGEDSVTPPMQEPIEEESLRALPVASWAPTTVFTSDSNLSDEELADIFGGS